MINKSLYKKIIIILVGLFLVVFIFLTRFSTQLSLTEDRQECITKTEERIVRGDSLSGLIESGETVEVLFGYYDCNNMGHNDVVLYQYSQQATPIIKIIKGIPEDRFELKQNNGFWNIFINNVIVRNAHYEAYNLSEQKSKMLSLYEKNYKGVIPENGSLILGNIISGSEDSTRFGLIGKSDILAKVIK